MSKERIKELQRLVGASPDGSIGFETMSKFAQKYKKTRIQTIHFFANIDHESGGFSIVRENMSYTAKRIMEIFGVGKHSARVTQAESVRLAGNPYDLAERVYGLGTPSKAKELGNLKAGDGWKYRGGGAIQITGGDAFKRFGDQNLYDSPDLIGTSEYYFTTAVKYFDLRSVWSLAVDLSTKSIETVCRRINGGLNGIKDRTSKIAKYSKLWNEKQLVDGVPQQVTVIKEVTASSLNIRKSPNGDIIKQLPKGTKVSVLGEEGNWTNVDASGIKGWVSKQYLQ